MTEPTALRRRSGSTKHDIVVGAAALFAERGYHAVSVQEIGERVGITGGAIYRHYPSKDAVLHAVMVDTIERWLTVARDAGTDERMDPVEADVRPARDEVDRNCAADAFELGCN